ncbi:periplasmic protein [Roseivivax jejudonensis]|uniref:Periplasmic protein n=1 Tax=Roseivivax jejudonensis TaxID=1529041 RepID=A0A1X6ZYV2_9RHOB|nr:BON domain-containing protein [Roseivivax jejudonensis]SLN65712.1 periplasmic protein [Roseivivax jejudonensis]
MSRRPMFRAWSDQHSDPETERGFHEHRSGTAAPYGAGPHHHGSAAPHDCPPRRHPDDDIGHERDLERLREIERERAARRDPRLPPDPWPGPEMPSETVAWPWADPLAPGPARTHDRPMLARARDEIASWIGGDAAAERRAEDFSGVGPRNYKRSDSRIAEDVNDDLTGDPTLDASDIEVTVRDCEVTLDGHVRSRRDKRRAEDWADHVIGVVHVQNNLRIRDSSDGSQMSAPGSTP